MVAGSWNTTGIAKVKVVDANRYRDKLVIQANAFGKDHAMIVFEDSEGDGLLLSRPGSSVTVRGWLARKEVWVVGVNCAGIYQEGLVYPVITEGL